jgi:dTDP-4-dehydrorhamnose 3,5-epimerase-like enzyme
MQTITFPVFDDPNGILAVFEGAVGAAQVPFSIARVFTVLANKGAVRGKHAHYRCTQLLVCLSGAILVTCFDGTITEEVILESSGEGILIPPRIWATQEFQKDNSIMMVLCDRVYEPEDYIRDYQTFINLKLSKA